MGLLDQLIQQRGGGGAMQPMPDRGGAAGMDPNVLMTLLSGGMQQGGPPAQPGGPPMQQGGPPMQQGGPPMQQGGPPMQQGGPQGGLDPMQLRMMLAQFERAQQAQARQPTSVKPKPLWGK